MQYITFDKQTDFSIAILSYDLDYPGMLKNYVEKGFIQNGASQKITQEIIAYNLPYETTKNGRKKKAPKIDEQREYLEELLEILDSVGVRHILVANPDYFKTLSGAAKAAAESGALVCPDVKHFTQYGHMRIAYVPHHRMAFYDPEKTALGIKLATQAVLDHRNEKYVPPGQDILKKVYFPRTDEEIAEALAFLKSKSALSIDIEGFSLHHHDAGIASIAFSWNQHEGIAFQCDWAPGFLNMMVRRHLRIFFFEHFKKWGELASYVYHHGSYDVTVLIHQLAMDIENIPPEHTSRIYQDLFDILANPKTLQDTKIISYLATNSTAGNKLGLKEQAVEFAGNYAVDVTDVTKIPVDDLLRYNVIDTCSTIYVYEKNYPKMVQDKQEDIYYDLFIPSLIDIVDMQLTGLPVDMEQVKKSKAEITKIYEDALQVIQAHPITIEFTHHLKEQYVAKKNAEYKKKRITTADVDLVFNPGSDIQLAGLLYGDEFFNLPVLGKTDSGAPSTKGAYIKALKAHTTDQSIIEVLEALIELKDASILLSTFIPALENARQDADGNYWMYGGFNLGGTVSGRLSSSDPNLQNIPSKSRLAKHIKLCIKAPPGYLFVGLDFDSLEDKISALITKDPNKLKVYMGHNLYCVNIDGIDHHIRDDTVIEYDGKTYNGDAFYAAYTDGLL